MLIGEDFDKIEINVFGLKLLEINAFYGDTILFIVALILAYKIHAFFVKTSFFIFWTWFFIIFGVGFFMGGFGHLLFYYWGVPGKYFSWYFGIVAVLMVELAMISIYPNQQRKRLLNMLFKIKFLIAILTECLLIIFVNLEEDPQKGLIVPTINSIIGLGITLGVMGYLYQKKVATGFKYLWISALILIPSAVFQSMKINFHQWFDRNDVSHILLIISLLLYFKAIKGYYNSLKP